MKRVFALLIAFVMIISFSSTVYANDLPGNRRISDDKSIFLPVFGNQLFSETHWEGDVEVTERIYFQPSDGKPGKMIYDPNSDTAVIMATSGSGTYTSTKTHKWASGTIMTYYASGFFRWGNGDVSVSQIRGNVSGVPSGVTISNRNTVAGGGRYGFIFNKYASVTFSFDAKNAVGLTQSFSTTIKVSETGTPRD